MSDKSNPYFKRKKGMGEAGRKVEKTLAKKLGGKLTIGSGALDFQKGDIKLGEFLIESKSTVKDSYKIDLNVLAKIKGEALCADKEPVLAISFTNGNGKIKECGSWAMIEYGEFVQYMEYKKSLESL